MYRELHANYLSPWGNRQTPVQSIFKAHEEEAELNSAWAIIMQEFVFC